MSDATDKQTPPYLVQVGRFTGRYKTRWEFETFGKAFMWYSGLNVHSGYKKRIVNGKGKVIVRQFG